MAERYVSFRMGKETSLGSEVAPSSNNPFMDGTFVFAYNNKYNHFDSSDQIVDGRLYIDAAIDGNNYRFPVNSECSYFLINKEDGTDFEMGDTNRPIYFSGGVPQPVDCISTAYGGTGLKSFTANRMVWTSSTSALSISGHYVDVNHFAVNSETLPDYNFYVNGTSAMTNILTFINATTTKQKITTSSGSMYYASASTTYIDSGSNSSLIFRPQGTEQARFNTSGQLQIKATGAANATVIGPAKAGTFYFPNTGGTFVTHATRGTAVGGTAKPVYIATTGRATALSATVGSTIAPTYLDSGTITACKMTTSGAWWGALPAIASDGVMEIGKYINFHTEDTGMTDFDYRLTATTSNLTGSGSLTATTFLKSTTYTSVGSYLTAGTYVNAATGFGVTQTAGTGSGISLYGSHTGTTPTYGLMFAKTATFGTFGGVTSDWATYFTMSGSDTRGWIFRKDSTNVCSINGIGGITSYINSTSEIDHTVANSNGKVGINSSTNRGLYDYTADRWIIYTQKSSNTTRIPTWLYLDTGAVVASGKNHNIQRAGKSSSWYDGRDNTFIRTTTCDGYSPTISMKCTDGSWEIGTYNSSSYANQLIFNYMTDANYNSAINTPITQIRFGCDGICLAPVWYSTSYYRTANYGTGNPGSSTAGQGIPGALYFKIIS